MNTRAKDKIMHDVKSGSQEPFIIYRDNTGGWHCDHTQNQFGEAFEWVKRAKMRDPFASEYTGKEFSNGSFAHERVRKAHRRYGGYAKRGQDSRRHPAKAAHSRQLPARQPNESCSNFIESFSICSFKSYKDAPGMVFVNHIGMGEDNIIYR